MIKRKIDIKSTIEEMSVLLLGPRQTGKSTFIKKELGSNFIKIDLLESETFRDYQKSPSRLKDVVSATEKTLVIIDEIQKIPELLDVVHLILEDRNDLRFLLTGSSARKLKKNTTNLLGGRAYPMFMHPITTHEYLNSDLDYDLNKLIQFGGLPSVLTSKNPVQRLKAYIGIYLQEEIKAEGFVRNLSDFSKFLDIAALTNSEQLDYNGVASDAQISARTVSSYYQILQDTLLGYLLEPYKETKTRKAVTTPKFYFFDVGVANHLAGREQLVSGTPEYGKAVEHLVFTEILAYNHYFNKDLKIYYWRSASQFEVDFLIQTKNKKWIAIEVKASGRIDKSDYKGIKALNDDLVLERKIIVSLERESRRTEDDFEIFPMQTFFDQLWVGKIV
jgi:uncharacterized protein